MRTELHICQAPTHPQDTNQDLVNVKLNGCADDNAASTDAQVSTRPEAQAILHNLQEATEALTIGLGVVVVRRI